MGEREPRDADAADEWMDAQIRAHLERLHAGDERALADILALVRPIVARKVRYRMASLGTAHEDVVQEICLALVKAIPTFRWDGKPFMAFVSGIAAHKIADAFRARGRDRTEPLADPCQRPDPGVGPEQAALNAELGAHARSLVDTLPAAQREILHLRFVIGLGSVETAHAVGSTPGAVRVAQHRALNTLRKRLKGQA
ncbi:sigma-70 family RNA polymerase sigma factor [Actinokineospora pegani]|uniref:sigma-70 family RNA polymerase sigma factor n=1 Tax=Actinokineospora pegani TaxID=2654637 RepID=UPI0012EA1632|nr:sigma-70 family RNA polymerase sigma factor [Actinokineospora pegani]